MSRLIGVAVVLLLALSAFLGWRLSRAHEAIGTQRESITGLTRQLSDARGQLMAVDLMARANDALQLRLQRRQDALAAAAADRDMQLKRLLHENADVKRWADAPLPADIIRLQNRPAVTGAGGYQGVLSGGEPLHAAREPAGH